MYPFARRYRRPTAAEIEAALSTTARVWSASDVAAAIAEHAPEPVEYDRPTSTQLRGTGSAPYVWAPADVREAARYHGASVWKNITSTGAIYQATTTAGQSVYTFSQSTPTPQTYATWRETMWGTIEPNGESVGLAFQGACGGPNLLLSVANITALSNWRMERVVTMRTAYEYVAHARIEVLADGIGNPAVQPIIAQTRDGVANQFTAPAFAMTVSFGTAFGAGTYVTVDGGSLTFTASRPS